MKTLLLSFIPALFALSTDASALEVTSDAVYDACLAVETPHAAADGQEDPKLAAHYFCTIVADDCRDRPDGRQCTKAKRQYGLVRD